MKLIEYIKDAEARKVAIGHFNISNLEGLHGVIAGAKSLNSPVIIGVSEGERDFVGIHEIVALVKSLREQHKPIFLNADHTYSFERVKEAVDAGFDAVIFDGAKLPIEQNIAITKQCVEYAKSKNPNILVEGELGYIGMSSKLLDELPEGAASDASTFTKPEDAKHFVEATGVDLLAPAVGNVHGMLKHSKDPHLDIARVKAIREAAGIPLVLHGGSGTPDEDFVAAIENGTSIVHISTELRVALRKGLEAGLSSAPEEIAPYRYLAQSVKDVEQVVTERLKLFNGLH